MAAAALALAASTSAAQGYPSKPLRIVIPFTPGSASDILARLIAPKLIESWGQQVVVDNRPSAGGTVAGEIVARATPDGHTLMLTSSAFAGSAALYDKLPYDSVRDFSGISQVAETALVLVVAPSLGVKSAQELIALARAKPGYLTFASSGIGSGTHYGSELFKMAAGINVVHVPFRGTPEGITDTMAGRVHYYLTPLLPVMPLVKSGRLLPLGVTTEKRQPSGRRRCRGSSTTAGSASWRRRARRARRSTSSPSKSPAYSTCPTSRTASRRRARRRGRARPRRSTSWFTGK